MNNWLCCLVALGVAAPGNALAGQAPLLSATHEVSIALSAAPPQLRAGAGVFVLKRSGFIRVRPSLNGFNCLVERGRASIAPVCYDSQGSRTTLQASLERARLASSGISEEQIDAMIDHDYEIGRLRAPSKPGIAYMLSSDFLKRDPSTGSIRQVYPPHIMIYTPYLHNSDFGIPETYVRSVSHIWVEGEGRPDACIVVPQAQAATKT